MMNKRSNACIYLILLLSIVMTLCACAFQPKTDIDSLTYPPLKFSIPDIKRTVLDNGIIIYAKEDPELPLVNMTAVVRTGSVYDPDGKEGVAELTGTVMRTGGTSELSGDRIDEMLDLMACELSISVGSDSAIISMSSLTKDIDACLSIFADILKNPAFEEEKLGQAKNIKKEDLRRLYDNPPQLAFRQFAHILYGNNPRGRLLTLSSVEAIERNDLVAFHGNFFFPDNIMIAVSGDLPREAMITMVDKYLGGWEKEGSIPNVPTPDKHERMSLNYLYKDIPQSVIITGRFAPGEKSEEYYDFSVLDFIIGSGGFNSRITRRIRNEMGLAYSAGSFYSPKPDFGTYGAYAMTKTASTATALSELMAIEEAMRHEPVSFEEIEWAKKSIINSFIFSFTTVHDSVLRQMMVEYEGLPGDYLESYRKRINKVSADDVQRVAEAYLSPENGTILVLGNKEGFDRPLSDFGEVNVVEIHY